MDMNRRILQKISESDTEEEIREFLKEIFVLELEHSGSQWKHGRDYERLIRKYTKKWEGQV